MNITDIIYKGKTVKEIINNVEDFFDVVEEDCINPYNFEVGEHKYNLFIGYDRFTVNEDGTICNSDKDEKQYYIEIYENFFEENGFEPASEEPVFIIWLLDFDKEDRTGIVKTVSEIINKIKEGEEI